MKIKLFGAILVTLLFGLFSVMSAHAQVHNRPVTTSTLSPAPTSPGSGLFIYSDPVTVTLNATADTGYSIANTYYKLDGGSQQTYSGSFTVSGTGKHSVEYWSIDSSGIEELTHGSKGFTIEYQHGIINSIAQNGINIDVSIHIDNIQPYLNYINTANSGNNCYNDGSAAFEIYNAATGALVSSAHGEAKCVNQGPPSEGNQALVFPPIQLQSGSYRIHYSGGPFDWITEDFVYTAPVLHNPPTSSAVLSPSPSTPVSGLTIYPNPTTVTLSATADAGYSISNIFYKVDGGAQQTYSGPFTVSGVQKHHVEYWSIDNTGFAEHS